MRKTMFRYTDINGVIMLPFILLFSLVSLVVTNTRTLYINLTMAMIIFVRDCRG